MYKISTDSLFGTIKVSGCGFLSVPPYLKEKKREKRKCALHLRKENLTVGGAMCRHKRGTQESNVWQSVHLLHSPTVSIAFSFYFSLANNIKRKKLHHIDNKIKNSTKQVLKSTRDRIKKLALSVLLVKHIYTTVRTWRGKQHLFTNVIRGFSLVMRFVEWL